MRLITVRYFCHFTIDIHIKFCVGKQLERKYMTLNRRRWSKIIHFQQKSSEICVFMQVIFLGATLEPE
jgi:hypothetical protein